MENMEIIKNSKVNIQNLVDTIISQREQIDLLEEKNNEVRSVFRFYQEAVSDRHNIIQEFLKLVYEFEKIMGTFTKLNDRIYKLNNKLNGIRKYEKLSEDEDERTYHASFIE